MLLSDFGLSCVGFGFLEDTEKASNEVNRTNVDIGGGVVVQQWFETGNFFLAETGVIRQC